MPKQGLLEFLANECGCSYLSDLHTQNCRQALSKIIHRLTAGSYSDREWSESFAYILGRSASAQTAEEIRQELIQAVSEKK